MILLRIVSSNENQLREIASYLLKEKLVIDVNLKNEIERLILENDHLASNHVCILTAKTKALLFQTINQYIQDRYQTDVPEIYSLPIIYIDWNQAESLKSVLRQV